MNLLVFCPTHRLEPQTLNAVVGLNYGGALDITFTKDNPHGNHSRKEGYANILHNYRKMRRLVLDGGYDAVLVVESDIIPPPDTLPLLTAVGADLVTGVYVLRGSKPTLNVYRKKATLIDIDQSLTFYPRELARAWKAGVVECGGGCMGCLLIRRHVLERIEFRDGFPAATDLPFMTDCNRAGFRTMAHFGVVCGHIKPNGATLWPTPQGVKTVGKDEPRMRRIRALTGIAGWMGDHWGVIQAGEEGLIDEEAASGLVATGQAEYT